MARVFVTGSADGLGKMAAELLIDQGHKVVLHARSAARAEETRKKVGGAEHIVVGDLSSIADTKSVADQVNRLGRFAVIHNAGIGYREPQLVKTVDGLPQLFAVNTLAPYLLTALIITMPKRRLVYLSSGMHYGAGSHLNDMLWEKRRWNGSQAYAETKFQDVLLSFAVARHFPEVKSNSLEPGWVPTKMGGAGAPDDIEKAHRTQVWLATSDEPAATVSGRYFFHQKLRDPDPATKDVERQDLLLDLCRSFRHCFEGAVTEGGSMSWYIDIDEGKLEGEISWDLELGWERYIGEGRFVGMHRFDASGKIADVYKKFDINAEAVVRAARRWRRLPLYDIEDPDVGRSRPAASAPSRSVNVSP